MQAADDPIVAFVDAKYTAFVSADVDKIWNLVGDFGNLDWAFNQTTTIVSGADNQPGAIRRITSGNTVFYDELLSVSIRDFSWTFLVLNFSNGYQLITGDLPCSSLLLFLYNSFSYYPGPLQNAITSLNIYPVDSPAGAVVTLRKQCQTDSQSYAAMLQVSMKVNEYK